MDIVNKIREFASNSTFFRPSTSLQEEEFAKWLGISETPYDKRSEITYFTCLKLLAETLAKMPIKCYNADKTLATDDEVYKLLKIHPNKQMTPTAFLFALENNRNHFGNGYVYINRYLHRKKYGGEYGIEGLYIMQSDCTTLVVDDAGVFKNAGDIWYWYQDPLTGESYFFPSEDVLHVKTSTTFNGLVGLPVVQILKATIEGALASQNFMNNLYKEGLTARATLQYTGDLDRKKQKQLVAKFEEYTKGAQNAGKFIPVPIGMEIKPLNISLTESQFFELKKYSALQIAAAMGIKPNQINDYEKSSYNSSEMQNLTFYIDTIQVILKQYEEEFNYKLTDDKAKKEGKYYKFNEKVILRTTAEQQQKIECGYVQNGVKMPSEVRENLDMPFAPGSDILMCNGNYKPITEVSKEE